MNLSAYGKRVGKSGSPDEGLGLRVFVDSNILISALLAATSVAGQVLTLVLNDHYLVPCDYCLAEVAQVIRRKFPTTMPKWEIFLASWRRHWGVPATRERLPRAGIGPNRGIAA